MPSQPWRIAAETITFEGHYVISVESLQIQIEHFALAAVAQWIEHQPVNQRVTGSIPSQGTCLACGPGPQ